jgi:ribose 5-phosphate isomerase B
LADLQNIQSNPSRTVALGADHAGAAMKQALKEDLVRKGYDVLDLGTHGEESVDYPDFADAVSRAVSEGRAERGVLVCGTGIGMSMAANRHKGVRAAVCTCSEGARLARAHNDANVLCLGARLTSEYVARQCLDVFLEAAFEGGRHARRVAKLG